MSFNIYQIPSITILDDGLPLEADSIGYVNKIEVSGSDYIDYLPEAQGKSNYMCQVVRTDNNLEYKATIAAFSGESIVGFPDGVVLTKQGDSAIFFADGGPTIVCITNSTTLVGDSGTGGMTGLVPAPAIGDGALGKFLNADGSWKIAPSQFDATVGTGGQYATVNLALADSKKTLCIVGNATETANVNYDAEIIIQLNKGAIWNLGDFTVINTGSNTSLTINGDGIIEWTPTTPKALFNGLGNGTLIRNNLFVNGSNSTADDCPLYDNYISVASTGITQFALPNQHGWGIHMDTTFICIEQGAIAFINQGVTGTNIYNLLSNTTDASKVINFVIVGGELSATQPIINSVGYIGKINRLAISAPQLMLVNIGGSLNNTTLPSGFDLQVNITADNAQIINCNLGVGDVDVDSFQNVVLENVQCNNVLNATNNTIYFNVKRAIDNIPFINNLQLYQGIRNTITNGSSMVLTNADVVIQRFIGTASHSVFLPNATTLLNSKQFLIQNESTGQISVNYDNTLFLSNVDGGTDVLFTLADNSTTNGVWHVSPVSSGSGIPGGSAGQLQYNNTGAFGGASITTDGTGLLSATNWEITDDGDATANTLTLADFMHLGNLTTTERNALTPADGMMIYNTTTTALEYYANGAWRTLPNQVLSIQGNWNASTNTPTLTAGVGTDGHAYYVSVSGTQTIPSGTSTNYSVGDLVYYASAIWNNLSSGNVSSVFGRGGVVVAQTGDYTIAQVTNGLSNVLATNSMFVGDGSNIAIANTPTQVTALLNTMGGDTGSGGLKGLAPAQVAGDAVKFLKGDATWSGVNSITSTVTSAGTTTLTVASTNIQLFTGLTTQTVVLPNATTLANGTQYLIQNESSGAIAVNMNGGSSLTSVSAVSDILLTLASNGTSSGTWHVSPSVGGVSFPITIAQGGTNTTTQPTSGGATYFDGTKITTSVSNNFINFNGSGQTGIGGVANASYTLNVTGKTNTTGLNSSLNVVKSANSIATTGTSFVITVASQGIQRFTGTLTENVFLPSATTLPVGIQYEIYNDSTQSIVIKNNAGTTLVTVPTLKNTTVTLYNNSTAAGIWGYSAIPTTSSTEIYVGDYKMSGQSADHGVWKRCDGSAISRTTYSALFALIGTSFGAGDGSTTFNIPDFRGRVYGTTGTGSGLTNRIMGQTAGQETVTLTSGQIPSHNHAWSNRYQGIGTGGSGANALVTSTSAFDGTSTVTPASFGSGAAHENMQPTLFGGNIFICYSGL